MRNFVLVAGTILACSGCVAASSPEPVISQVTTKVASDDPNCREYTALATIGDKQQPVVGRACQQRDGSWKVTEGTPEQPGQYAAVYPPPYGYYYPDYDPWFWGPPIGLSLGAVVFLDRAHHFHRFPGFHRFAHGGFHGGFHGEFHHGGFGHGGLGGMHRG